MNNTEVTRAEDGFSLLEMVVAMGILIVLILGGVLSYNGIQQDAKETAVESAAKAIYNAARSYQEDNKSSTSAQRAAEEYNTHQSKKLPDGRPMMHASIDELENSGLRVTVVYGNNEAMHILEMGGNRGTDGGTGNPGSPDPSTDNNGTPTPAPAPTTRPVNDGTTCWVYSNGSWYSAPCPKTNTGTDPTAPTIIQDAVSQYTYQCSSTVTGRLPMINLAPGTTVNVYGSDDSARRVSYTDASNVVTTLPEEGTGKVFSMTEVLGVGEVVTPTNIPEPITMDAGVTYTIIVDGTFGALDTYVSSESEPTLRDCIVSVDDFSDKLTHIHQFAGAKLTDVPDALPNTVTSLNGAFHSASVFNDAGIANWDVSNVTSLAGTFEKASAFNVSINTWKVHNVTDMQHLFHSALAYNKPMNTWDTSNVTNMGYMFADTSFNYAINTGTTTWRTSNVTTMEGMFKNARTFNQLIDKWDVSKVTTMESMFEGALRFNQRLTWNVSSVTNMIRMFYGAKEFNQDIYRWNVSNVVQYKDFRTGAKLYYGNTPPKFT